MRSFELWRHFSSSQLPCPLNLLSLNPAWCKLQKKGLVVLSLLHSRKCRDCIYLSFTEGWRKSSIIPSLKKVHRQTWETWGEIANFKIAYYELPGSKSVFYSRKVWKNNWKINEQLFRQPSVTFPSLCIKYAP